MALNTAITWAGIQQKTAKHAIAATHVAKNLAGFSHSYLFMFSPPPSRHPLLRRNLAHVDAHHGFAQVLAALQHALRIVEERRRLDDGLGPLGRVAALEDAAAHEDGLRAELAHERRVGRRGD